MSSYQGVCIKEDEFVKKEASHKFRAPEKSVQIYLHVMQVNYMICKVFTSPRVKGMLPVSWLLSTSLHRILNLRIRMSKTKYISIGILNIVNSMFRRTHKCIRVIFELKS